jgi:putative ABC transport system permease protein
MAVRFSHVVRVGLRALAAHRLRSMLTALGIVLGVASVIVMLAVGEAARYEALKQLEDLGANTILLRSMKPAEDNSERKGADLFAYGLTYADLGRIRDTIPTVTSATPTREFRKTIRHRELKLEVRLVSVNPVFFKQNNIKVSRGRAIEDADEEKLDNVAVIGASAADALFPAEDPVGKTVGVDGLGDQITFTIVGVTEDKKLAAGTLGGGDAEFARVLFIPFATDRARIGRELVTFKNGYNIERLDMSQITVTVDTLENVPRTAQVLQALIDQYHPQKDVQAFVPLELLRKAEETQRLFTLILGAIAGISLVVGGIGIMNIMLATVTERTREIGIRRALGAKQRDIATQFLIETLVLSCGGGLIGIALGMGLAYGLTELFGVPTLVRSWSPMVAFSTSVLVGLLSGLYPARRAARLDPIEALRHN